MTTGNVVSRPVVAALHPVALLMSSTRGATATTAGRRFAATNMIAMAVRIVVPLFAVSLEVIAASSSRIDCDNAREGRRNVVGATDPA
jgi:hypothetical protein